MSSSKKPDTPKVADSEPANSQATQPTKATLAFWQRTTRTNNKGSRPTAETAGRVMARLGSSLHVKGEMSGNEDLYIEGTDQCRGHPDEGKLTFGAP